MTASDITTCPLSLAKAARASLSGYQIMMRSAGLAGLIDRQEIPDDVRRILAEILADEHQATNMLRCLAEILHHVPVGLAILQGPELRYLRINRRR